MGEELSCILIRNRGSEVVISPMACQEGLEEKETDWRNRLPKRVFWRPLKEVVDVMSGRAGGEAAEQRRLSRL
ncbi:6-phosphofructokinase, alpha subunit [Ascosphaera atra]|nr:6-phosphofructokinase, alpha subunit [Ascosphaera atra]